MALDIIKRPISNVPMAGALAAASGIADLDSIYKSIDDQFSEKLREKNKKLLLEAYSNAKGDK